MALDARKSHYTYVAGIKGSGKSEYAYQLAEGYPFDRLIVDVTHDVSTTLRQRGIPFRYLESPIPSAWPEWMRDQDVENGRLTLVFKPDMGSPDAFDDMDRCVGLCLRGGPPTLLWLDEIGEVCTGNRTGPAMKRALHHGRHDNLSMIMCGPRSKDVNPLCIGNCDRCVTFRMLNKYDREAIVRNLGADQAEFDRENKALEQYEHQVWERATEEIETFGKLPKWRLGRRPPPELAWSA
jgi:hypothetical protein